MSCLNFESSVCASASAGTLQCSRHHHLAAEERLLVMQFNEMQNRFVDSWMVAFHPRGLSLSSYSVIAVSRDIVFPAFPAWWCGRCACATFTKFMVMQPPTAK